MQSGPFHTVAFHMPIRWFQQIKRFLYILDAKDDIRQGKHSTNDEW